jgi:hypothetical protein
VFDPLPEDPEVVLDPAWLSEALGWPVAAVERSRLGVT